MTLKRQIEEQFTQSIEYINLGGGFASPGAMREQSPSATSAVPSFDDYAAAICGTLDELLPTDRPKPTLYLETGRALVDEAGYLIATVLNSRRSGDGRQSAIIDAGVNLLYTAASVKHDVWPARPRNSATTDDALRPVVHEHRRGAR